MVLAVAGALFLPGSAILWWPALGLALIAAAYLGWGIRVFQKSRGTLSAGAEWTLLPILLVQGAVRRRWRKGSPWADVDSRVRFGRRVSSREAEKLRQEGFVAVLDLASESTETRSMVEAFTYLQLSVLDLTVPHPLVLAEGVDFIREQAKRGRVYIHCELGFSRSRGSRGSLAARLRSGDYSRRSDGKGADRAAGRPARAPMPRRIGAVPAAVAD